MKVVESGSKNIELAVMRRDKESGDCKLEVLPEDQVELVCKTIDEEKAAAGDAVATSSSA